MDRQLMGFEIHLRFKNVGLAFNALPLETHKMGFGEMLLEFGVVAVVLRVATTISPIANMASLVLLSTMGIQFVISIEALSAEAAFRVTFEARLIDSTRIIVAKFLVLSQFAKGE
jgi:hypothetical protein